MVTSFEHQKNTRATAAAAHERIKRMLYEGEDVIEVQPTPGSVIVYRDRHVLVLATLPDSVLVLDGIKVVKIKELAMPSFITAQAPRRNGYAVAEHARALGARDLVIIDYLDNFR